MEKNIHISRSDIYQRITTSPVTIGNAPLGGTNPIRLQSMTNTNTLDIVATVEQSIRIIDAGADYVRITAPGVKEAEALKHIREQLTARGYPHPLVADIHFNPKAAIVAAQYVEKVRINPGNYVDKNNGTTTEYTDAQYALELAKIRQNLKPLLETCKAHGTAIRIGVNHGSLSDRIMSRFGDTPKGMVVSLVEFLEICSAEDFHDVALSIKASNTLIMVQACRMLVAEMQKQGRIYPLHLGVTEAGEGEDGRIKSAVGIGALLHDGIGDTVRVSLTEDPEAEIPVAKAIVAHCTRVAEVHIRAEASTIDPYTYTRRETKELAGLIGGESKPPVFADLRTGTIAWQNFGTKPEWIFIDAFDPRIPSTVTQLVTANAWREMPGSYPLFSLDEFACSGPKSSVLNCIIVSLAEMERLCYILSSTEFPVIIGIESVAGSAFRELRSAYHTLRTEGIDAPAISILRYNSTVLQDVQIQAACDAGPLFLDGLGDALCISAPQLPLPNASASVAFGILQASRIRFTKTEYISCPSCGRTLFDLQQTAQKIRQRTDHLSGLKIGIMGCIVNGPGEMADADYGYVGAGAGKVNLYRKKNVVRKGVPSGEAVEQLIELIRENGDWRDPA